MQALDVAPRLDQAVNPNFSAVSGLYGPGNFIAWLLTVLAVVFDTLTARFLIRSEDRPAEYSRFYRLLKRFTGLEPNVIGALGYAWIGGIDMSIKHWKMETIPQPPFTELENLLAPSIVCHDATAILPLCCLLVILIRRRFPGAFFCAISATVVVLWLLRAWFFCLSRKHRELLQDTPGGKYPDSIAHTLGVLSQLPLPKGVNVDKLPKVYGSTFVMVPIYAVLRIIVSLIAFREASMFGIRGALFELIAFFLLIGIGGPALLILAGVPNTIFHFVYSDLWDGSYLPMTGVRITDLDQAVTAFIAAGNLMYSILCCSVEYKKAKSKLRAKRMHPRLEGTPQYTLVGNEWVSTSRASEKPTSFPAEISEKLQYVAGSGVRVIEDLADMLNVSQE